MVIASLIGELGLINHGVMAELKNTFSRIIMQLLLSLTSKQTFIVYYWRKFLN